MDNFTHSLAGWALGQAGLKTKTRKGLAALVLGANMPDIDVFLGWVPWVPLATHRGWTHSLVGGVLLMPLLLVGLLWAIDRWQIRRGATFASGLPMQAGWLVALCYIGTLTHPLLDWQTTYAIQLFTPFDSRWYHTDALFIADVWLWSGLAGAIWLSRRRERSGRPWQRPPLVALAGVASYVIANAALSQYVSGLPERTSPASPPDVIAASPPPVLFWQRDLAWRERHQMWSAHYDPLVSAQRLLGVTGPTPDGMALPLVRRAARADRGIEEYLRWSILPLARVTPTTCGSMVRFSDARYPPVMGTARLSHTVFVPTQPGAC